jgi:hypothetical protein
MLVVTTPKLGAKMLVVTTPSLEGRRITRYWGLVSGKAILGANIFRMGSDASSPTAPTIACHLSLWSSCFDFSRKRGKTAASVTVPSARADWRTQLASSGDGPVRSDVAESLVKATQVHAMEERQHLFGDGWRP